MDWRECVRERIVKNVKKDSNLIKSTREIAEIKVKSADALPDELYIGKISLLYDALREYLEALALENNFKIYNHECYSAFLGEILKMPREALLFDRSRRVRNSINYYGRKISLEEAKQVIRDITGLMRKFRR